jgi:hypothetical protein
MSLLRARGSGRVLSHATLRRLVERHVNGEGATASVLIDALVHVKAVHKVSDGIYLNYMATPLPSPAEALKYVVKDGVLSLHLVLGQAGVLNNPTFNYTCVRPASEATQEGELELVGTRMNRHNTAPLFWAYTVDPAVMAAGDVTDNIDTAFSYPRATIEKAFCDWLYLASLDHPQIGGEPPLDCDTDLMDQERLGRIASAMGVLPRLQNWLERHRVYKEDHDVEANLSSRLGF